MKKVSEMNGNEKIAWKNIKGIFGYNVGGWYNSIQDGYPEDVPATREEAAELIYEDSLVNAAGCGCYYAGRAPREMRFAGREFIIECINYLLDTDGDAQEIAAEIWNKPEADREEDSKEQDGSDTQSQDAENCGGVCWIGDQAMLMWAAM